MQVVYLRSEENTGGAGKGVGVGEQPRSGGYRAIYCPASRALFPLAILAVSASGLCCPRREGAGKYTCIPTSITDSLRTDPRGD